MDPAVDDKARNFFDDARDLGILPTVEVLRLGKKTRHGPQEKKHKEGFFTGADCTIRAHILVRDVQADQ